MTEWHFFSRDPADSAKLGFIPSMVMSDLAFVLFRSFDFTDLLFVVAGPGTIVIHAIGTPLTGRERDVLDRFRPIGVRIQLFEANMGDVLEMVSA